MVRKQKVYEVGTLICRWKQIPAPGAVDNGHIADRENGIIIDRVRMKGRYPIEYRYVIRWDSGETFHVSPKVLKGLVKSGRFEILSEG